MGRSETGIESQIATFPDFEHLEAKGRLRPPEEE